MGSIAVSRARETEKRFARRAGLVAVANWSTRKAKTGSSVGRDSRFL
jgi:hypothetical protein